MGDDDSDGAYDDDEEDHDLRTSPTSHLGVGGLKRFLFQLPIQTPLPTFSPGVCPHPLHQPTRAPRRLQDGPQASGVTPLALGQAPRGPN
eukprot:5699537-Pyramimonas_sp.AAC.1